MAECKDAREKGNLNENQQSDQIVVNLKLITLQFDSIYQNQRPSTFVWTAADFGARHKMFLALNDGIKQSDFYLMTDISLENINLKRRELDVKKPIKQVNIFHPWCFDVSNAVWKLFSLHHFQKIYTSCIKWRSPFLILQVALSGFSTTKVKSLGNNSSNAMKF